MAGFLEEWPETKQFPAARGLRKCSPTLREQHQRYKSAWNVNKTTVERIGVCSVGGGAELRMACWTRDQRHVMSDTLPVLLALRDYSHCPPPYCCLLSKPPSPRARPPSSPAFAGNCRSETLASFIQSQALSVLIHVSSLKTSHQLKGLFYLWVGFCIPLWKDVMFLLNIDFKSSTCQCNVEQPSCVLIDCVFAHLFNIPRPGIQYGLHSIPGQNAIKHNRIPDKVDDFMGRHSSTCTPRVSSSFPSAQMLSAVEWQQQRRRRQQYKPNQPRLPAQSWIAWQTAGFTSTSTKQHRRTLNKHELLDPRLLLCLSIPSIPAWKKAWCNSTKWPFATNWLPLLTRAHFTAAVMITALPSSASCSFYCRKL